MIKVIEPGAVLLSKTGEQHPCTTHVRIDEMVDHRLAVDTVIIQLRQRPNSAWLSGLKGSVPEIYKIGDCLEPRHAIEAMADAGRIGRAI